MSVTNGRAVGAALAALALTGALSGCTSVKTDGSKSASAHASATSSSSSSAESTDAAPAPATSSESSSDSSSPDTSSSFDPSGKTGEVSGKKGDEVKTERMTAKIDQVTDPVPAQSGSLFTPDPGTKWVAAHLSVKNLDDKPLNFTTLMCVKGQSSGGQSVMPEMLGQYGDRFPIGEIQKDATASGNVLFQMAPSEHLDSVTVDCFSFGTKDDRSIRISLK